MEQHDYRTGHRKDEGALNRLRPINVDDESGIVAMTHFKTIAGRINDMQVIGSCNRGQIASEAAMR